jgi:putative DNA primase/helicase
LVLDDRTEHDGKKMRPGVWHFGLRAGKGEAPPALTQAWVCSPLYIDAVTTDGHEGNFGRLLRFRTTLGRWRTWAMPMELLRADGSDLRGELLAMGVEIDPSSHRVLAVYLQNRTPRRRIRCALQTGWANDKVFVLPDEVIGPGANGVAYQSGERGADEYASHGTLDGWRTGVAALAVGNPLLMLAVSAAFAGPVLARANAESGGIHLVGDSSTGKTTAIEAACSVWGGVNFRRSWRATSNGMEGVAALFNDSLLALDEISECDPREVGAIVYSLGNGRGKQRASKTGAARSVARWRCSVLSSGERTIGTTMAEGGHRIKAGQSVRLLDVPAQRRHGAWDDLHGHTSGAAFSDALRAASKANYGHAGRQFLRALTHDGETDIAAALEAMKAQRGFQAPDGQGKRAAARFALLALAGELATGYGITDWTPGQATAAAGVAFAAWKALRGPVPGNLEREQVLQRLAGFVDRHGDSRFSDVDDADTQRAAMVRDRAGWWEDMDGSRVYLFTAEGMREALKGFDFARGLDVLQQAGALPPPGADGKRSRTRRIGGRAVKVYAIDAARLEGQS